ncbi:MAG TPA: sulfurtransferase [Gemmatimonadaceae bacterium]|nr:sulfurtransferase [Gemmatimonadaceae bacterium]
MKHHARFLRASALAVVAAVSAPVAASAQSPGFDSPIVSPDWLSQHLNDPGLVIVHVANNRREYNTGHVPGARMVWGNAIAPSNPDLSTELPPLAQLDSIIESLGISNNSKVVLYGTQLGTGPARAFMTLEYVGMEGRVALLDGGFTAWKEKGLAVSTDPVTAKRAKFTPKVNANVVVTGDFVNANLDKAGIKILDARTPNFYNGDPAGQPRPGHIPSAGNVPFTTVVDEKGMLKSREAITQLLTDAGVKPGDRVVTYCHIGQQGSLLYFASRYAGYQTSLYDGSFDDWSNRPEFPVVGPTKKP